MKRIGLTGGIATGKSTVVDWLKSQLGSGLVVFDSDLKVQALLQEPELAAEIADRLGLGLKGDGTVDKAVLRERVFSDSDAKAELESILHPKVLKECLASAEEAEHRRHAKYFVADIPLLFEAAYDWPVETIWTVACQRQTQLARLTKRSGFSSELAARIIDAQLPIDLKVGLSDLVLWNEGPLDCLHRQLDAINL